MSQCKKEVDALELHVEGNDVIKNAFDDKKWYCHKQTLTPSYQKPDMKNVTAEYTLDKNNVVHITNCGVRPNGKQTCVSFLRGTKQAEEYNAKFIVKPWFVPSFLAGKTTYWILDQSNEHMIVSEGNPKISQPNCMRKPAKGQGLWILTNSSVRNNDIMENAAKKIKELGIDDTDMKDIVQD